MSEQANKAQAYETLKHAMQAGVAMELSLQGIDGIGPYGQELKHLRVGINAAMSDHSALVGLLIAKGVIGMDEYLDATAVGMAREVKRYEESLSKSTGASITLGGVINGGR